MYITLQNRTTGAQCRSVPRFVRRGGRARRAASRVVVAGRRAGGGRAPGCVRTSGLRGRHAAHPLVPLSRGQAPTRSSCGRVAIAHQPENLTSVRSARVAASVPAGAPVGHRRFLGEAIGQQFALQLGVMEHRPGGIGESRAGESGSRSVDQERRGLQNHADRLGAPDIQPRLRRRCFHVRCASPGPRARSVRSGFRAPHQPTTPDPASGPERAVTILGGRASCRRTPAARETPA